MKLPNRLDNKAIDQFYDEGYTVIDGVFDALEIREIAEAFDRLQDVSGSLSTDSVYRGSQFVLERYLSGEGEEDVRIHRIVWCAGAEPILGTLGRKNVILELAAQVLESREMDQLINQAHFKLPGDGVRFEWHQDCLHRRYGTDEWTDVNGRGSFLEIIVAIDAMTEENGPLQLIPFSCNQGALPVDPATRSLLPGSFDPEEAITLKLQPGSALLIGPYTIHGSGCNESTGPRRVFLNGFASPGANRRIYPGCGTGRRVVVC